MRTNDILVEHKGSGANLILPLRSTGYLGFRWRYFGAVLIANEIKKRMGIGVKFNNNCILIRGIYVGYHPLKSPLPRGFESEEPHIIDHILGSKFPVFHEIYVVRCPVNPRPHMKHCLFKTNLPTLKQETRQVVYTYMTIRMKIRFTSASGSIRHCVANERNLLDPVQPEE